MAGRRGRKRRLEQESQYWRLLTEGVGTAEACREVGIGRKTGFQWRRESGGFSQARRADPERSGRYLSQLERQRIAVLAEGGHSIREIGRRLDRSASTTSRKLRRNRAGYDRGPYDGGLAQARARERSRRSRDTRLTADPVLRAVVADCLQQEWSPEQIASHLRATYPHEL